ncbi:MAG: META domain-containing protein [Bacteroidales bacterium]|nr:META domain-containing protein [Bacteroidales bacterium]
MKKIIPLMFICLMCCTCCKTTKKAASGDMPLCQTQWNLVTIEQEALSGKSSVQPYIMFDAEGNFYGNLGCNDFQGTYYQRKQKIKLEYSGATKKLCKDMEVEKAFMKALKSEIDNFTIAGNVLILSDGSKEIMRFEGTAPTEE